MRTILLLVSIATIIYAIATPTTATLGGWEKIKNINDPHIQELGKWAVLEDTKQEENDGLRFQKVVNGVEQIVHGVNYRLVIKALEGNGTHATYIALLFEEDSTNPKTRKLLSFRPAN